MTKKTMSRSQSRMSVVRLTLFLALSVAAAAVLSGCSTAAGTGTLIGGGTGTALGGLLGGIIGHQSGHTGAGVAIGSVVGGATGAGAGYAIGANVDKNRKQDTAIRQAQEDANTTIINITNSNGSVTPIRLVRQGTVWVGPRGEQYINLPTEEQLKAVYGF